MLCLIVSYVVTSNWKRLLGRYPLYFVTKDSKWRKPRRNSRESELETSLAYKSVPISPLCQPQMLPQDLETGTERKKFQHMPRWDLCFSGYPGAGGRCCSRLPAPSASLAAPFTSHTSPVGFYNFKIYFITTSCHLQLLHKVWVLEGDTDIKVYKKKKIKICLNIFTPKHLKSHQCNEIVSFFKE